MLVTRGLAAGSRLPGTTRRGTAGRARLPRFFRLPCPSRGLSSSFLCPNRGQCSRFCNRDPGPSSFYPPWLPQNKRSKTKIVLKQGSGEESAGTWSIGGVAFPWAVPTKYDRLWGSDSGGSCLTVQRTRGLRAGGQRVGSVRGLCRGHLFQLFLLVSACSRACGGVAPASHDMLPVCTSVLNLPFF